MTPKVPGNLLVSTTLAFPKGPAGGDLSGTYPNPDVIKLRGYSISNISPTDGYVLTWVNSNNEWEPKKTADIFTAAGDLTGDSSSQTVISLTGSSEIVSILANQLIWADTASPLIDQASTSDSPANSLSISAQDSTNLSGTGGNLILMSGTGNSLGGDLILSSGSGSTTGAIRIQPGGADTLTILDTKIRFDTSIVSFNSSMTPVITQDNGTGFGNDFTLRAQSIISGGSSDGGNLILESGEGATGFDPGNVFLRIFGNEDSISLTPNLITIKTNDNTKITLTDTVFTLKSAGNDTAIFNDTSVSFFDSTNANSLALFNDTTINFYSSGNSVVEIGSSYLSISNGTSLPTGGILRIPNDANITGVDSSGIIDVQLMRVSSSNNVDIGILNPSIDGYVNLQVQGTDVVSISEAKFITRRGQRVSVRGPTFFSFNVVPDDHVFAVDTTSGTTEFFLPLNPEVGDSYKFKDIGYTASTNPITLNGNGNNIDGDPTFIMDIDKSSVEIIFTNTEWSIF